LGKLLIIWGLNLKRKSKKKKISALQKLLIKLKGKANILARIKAEKALRAISSDISEIKYNNGKNKCYLCVHKDVYGQMVYGHEASENMKTELVLTSLKKARNFIAKKFKKENKKEKINIEKIVFHQDQGSQYTSYEYVEEVLKEGRISYSAKGTPTDNAGQESFFGRFKEENADEIMEIKDFKKVKKYINKKIRYYNNERIHTNADYTTPKLFTKLSLKI
jgi:putative transposase